MKWDLRKIISTVLVAGGMLFSPSFTYALTVTYLDSGYTASNFLSLGFYANSFTLDASDNLYIVNDTDTGTGTTNILKFNSASSYSTSTTYNSYSTSGYRSTGLDFDAGSYLFSSESNSGGNSGLIYRINTGTLVKDLYYNTPIRPTGIDADSAGNVYFTGRLSSDPFFGNIYKINPSMTLDIIVPGFIGRGIAVDDAGNLFATDSYNSLYMFDASTYSPTLIATLESPGATELTLDSNGNLYAINQNYFLGTTEILRISKNSVAPIPEPSTIFLFSSGALALTFYIKRRKR